MIRRQSNSCEDINRVGYRGSGDHLAELVKVLRVLETSSSMNGGNPDYLMCMDSLSDTDFKTLGDSDHSGVVDIFDGTGVPCVGLDRWYLELVWHNRKRVSDAWSLYSMGAGQSAAIDIMQLRSRVVGRASELASGTDLGGLSRATVLLNSIGVTLSSSVLEEEERVKKLELSCNKMLEDVAPEDDD